MKIGVITTGFMVQFITNILNEIGSEFSWEILIYHNFKDVIGVYKDNEDRFDGFLISGPVPKQVIEGAVEVRKPIRDFGTDLQSYYETFLSLIFKYGTDFSRCYFDMLDWVEEEHDMGYYLREGCFGELQKKMHANVKSFTVSEITEREEAIRKKHIALWKQGKIDYSCTRFSSILEDLQAEGVNCIFVYPHKQVVKAAVDYLKKEIDISRLKDNRTCAVSLRVIGGKEKVQVQILENALRKVNKKLQGDFRISVKEDKALILLGYKMVSELTEGNEVCLLKPLLQDLLQANVVLGYGIGTDLNSAVNHSEKALTEAIINMQGSSYLVDENGDLFGPLNNGKGMKVRCKVTPEIVMLAEKVCLSTLTVQKLISALDSIGRNEVTPQMLAEKLNITPRSANRFICNLVQYGEGELAYERQSASRGRPVRVYHLGLIPGQAFCPIYPHSKVVEK